METQVLDSGLRRILDAVTDGVSVVDPEGKIVFWNKGAERVTGVPSSEALGRHCADLLICTDLSGRNLRAEGGLLQVTDGTGEPVEAAEVFLMRKDGERVAVNVRMSALDVEGARCCVEVFSEVQAAANGDLAQRLQKFAESSIIDELTGLYDRRYIDTILDEQYGLFKRHFQRFGLVLVDIDGFKDMRETFGDLAADEVVKSVASILGRSPRSTDFLARYGEDEFIVVCPLIELEGIEKLSQRIVELVHHPVLSSAGPQSRSIDVTVSVGGSMVDYKDKTAADIVARAREAISRVQRDGGNWYGLG